MAQLATLCPVGFNARQVFCRGFNVDWAKEKHVGWVDFFYLKVGFRDVNEAKDILCKIENSTAQPKIEPRCITNQPLFPYVSRPQLEVTIKRRFEDARLVYLFGQCGSGKYCILTGV